MKLKTCKPGTPAYFAGADGKRYWGTVVEVKRTRYNGVFVIFEYYVKPGIENCRVYLSDGGLSKLEYCG